MRNGFNCIELAVVLGILALGSGLLLAAHGARGQDYLETVGKGKKRGDITKETVDLKNIHAAMAAYAESNKDWMPGLTSRGTYMKDGFKGKRFSAAGNAGNDGEQTSGAGCTIAAGHNLAMAIMLEEGGLTPAQLVSKGEISPDVAEAKPNTSGDPENPNGGKVESVNFSQAMLAYGRPSLKPEWKNNQNQQAVVMASRLNFGPKAGQHSSNWTNEESGRWSGVVVRGDSSVSVENAPGGEGIGLLKYGARPAFAVRASGNASVVGIFGAHTNMANFDATAKTGMLGSALDGAKEEPK